MNVQKTKHAKVGFQWFMFSKENKTKIKRAQV